MSCSLYTGVYVLLADENRVLDSLPKKMRADLAIHVHLGTLYKVSLFKVGAVMAAICVHRSLSILSLERK